MHLLPSVIHWLEMKLRSSQSFSLITVLDLSENLNSIMFGDRRFIHRQLYDCSPLVINMAERVERKRSVLLIEKEESEGCGLAVVNVSYH